MSHVEYRALLRPSYSVSELQDGSYKYVYGPTGLKGLLQNRTSLFYALFASIGGLTFGYEHLEHWRFALLDIFADMIKESLQLFSCRPILSPLFPSVLGRQVL
jgi:hypothetical protein